MENLLQQLEVLPGNLSSHLMITVIPLAIGIALSLTLAIFIIRKPAFQYPALTAVSVVQTVPSFALLALMVPVLAGLSVLTVNALGFEVPSLGFWPTIIALTMYSMLPVLRNSVTGILGVEPSLVEAARGVGMTARQVLWKVQLPLAAPVIIAGVRTATVWVVGIATLATPVGQRCLGDYVFRGLQTRNWTAVLVGCVAAMCLAILLDLLIGGVEKAVKERRRQLGLTCAVILAVIFGGGIFAPRIVRAFRAGQTGAEVRVGAKNFTEQYILSELIGSRLKSAGLNARATKGLGSTVVFDALVNGEIDVYVDYTGTIWANYMKRSEVAGSQRVLSGVTEWLRDEYGIEVLGALGFENAYSLAMQRKDAEQRSIETIADLAPYDQDMTLGADYEFYGRPEWEALKKRYGLAFADRKSYDSTFMYEAIDNDQVDVIAAFTTDGRIDAYDLKLLADPRNAIPPYDAILLVGKDAAQNEELIEALEPLIGAIGVRTMQRANYLVDREQEKKSVPAAAKWLDEQIEQTEAAAKPGDL